MTEGMGRPASVSKSASEREAAREGGDGRGGEPRLEIVIAAVLSIAGLLTSWAGYQAGLFDGEQVSQYARHDALRIQASRAHLEADARRAVEINLFIAWLEARARGELRLAAFYQRRFPPDLRTAFDSWVALDPLNNTNAPESPFTMPDYRLRGEDEARRLELEADKAFSRGQSDKNTSEHYTQAAVFLATALFFGGIGQVFKMRSVRLALLGVAVFACLMGFLRIVTLPAMRPT